MKKPDLPSLCRPVAVSLLASILGLVSTWAGESVPASITGNTLAINKQDLSLGAAQWADPERNWRTVGELLKTALPPADASGHRADVTLTVCLDRQAPWGALKCLCMAASALGIPRATVELPVRPEGNIVTLPLPGADPAAGEFVALPLFAGGATGVQTENGGQRIACTTAVLTGLVKQLPKATLSVQAPPSLPAYLVVPVLRDLHSAGAAAVAFLPVKQITAAAEADRKEAKDAVDRAIQGGMGGLLK